MALLIIIFIISVSILVLVIRKAIYVNSDQFTEDCRREAEHLKALLWSTLPSDERIITAVLGELRASVVAAPPIETRFGFVSEPAGTLHEYREGILAATNRRLIMYREFDEDTHLRVMRYDTVIGVERHNAGTGASVTITGDQILRVDHIHGQDIAVTELVGHVQFMQELQDME